MPYSGQVKEVQIPDGTIWEIPGGGGGSVYPATATPLMDGTGAVGVSAKYAREDHRHPSDASKQDILVSGTNIKTINGVSLLGSGDIVIPGTTVDPATNAPLMDGTAAVGTSVKYAREDHVHPSDASKQNALTAGANISIVGNTISATDTKYTAATATPLMDGTGAVGTSAKYARQDHRHPTDTSRAPMPVVTTHNSPVNVSIANATDTTIINTGAKSAGTYLLIVHASFEVNATGRRRIFVSTTTNGNEVDRYSQILIPAAPGAATEMTFAVVHTITSNTTWYLRVYQNSGGALNVNGGIRVVKIA